MNVTDVINYMLFIFSIKPFNSDQNGSHRLAAQDADLSRRKHGLDTPWDHQLHSKPEMHKKQQSKFEQYDRFQSLFDLFN